MYSEEFLRSLGLEEWIEQQEPQTCRQISATQDKTAPSVSDIEPSAQRKLELPTQAKNKPPRDCFNCEHSGQSDWCSLKETQIEDLDAETDCVILGKSSAVRNAAFTKMVCAIFEMPKYPRTPMMNVNST